MGKEYTLVLRLSGPQQSWGSVNRFRVRETLPYPTLSGLYGLARAALGHGRNAPWAEMEWLTGLKMAIRIDDKGTQIRDYHTINEYPKRLPADALFSSKEETKIVPTGAGTPWAVKGASTLITERAYRADATYLWLVQGEEDTLLKLAYAFQNPKWQLSLGRKKCVPDWLFLLGIVEADLITAAEQTPRIGRNSRPVELHILTQGETTHQLPTVPITLPDKPVGSHPHDGHIPNTRHSLWVTPRVGKRKDLLEWVQEHMENITGREDYHG